MPLPEYVGPEKRPIWCSLRGTLDWLLYDLVPLPPQIEFANRGTPKWASTSNNENDLHEAQHREKGKIWTYMAIRDRRLRYISPDYTEIISIEDSMDEFFGRRYNSKRYDYPAYMNKIYLDSISDLNFFSSIVEWRENKRGIYLHVEDLIRESEKDSLVEYNLATSNETKKSTLHATETTTLIDNFGSSLGKLYQLFLGIAATYSKATWTEDAILSQCKEFERQGVWAPQAGGLSKNDVKTIHRILVPDHIRSQGKINGNKAIRKLQDNKK